MADPAPNPDPGKSTTQPDKIKLRASGDDTGWTDEQWRQRDEEIENNRVASEDKAETQRRRDEWATLIAKRGARYKPCRVSNYVCGCEKQTAMVGSVRDYLTDIGANIKAGVNVLLFGPAGTGKDHILAAMMREAVLGAGADVLWRNGADLHGEVRDRIGTDSSEGGFIRKLVQPAVLAISDPVPPIGKLTDFQMQTLFRIVDGRYSHVRATWATLNVRNREEAIERMGGQVVDRLSHDALAIWCDWPSYRRKPA